MSEVLELPYTVEQVVEQMIELERGVCPLCLGRCTMRVDDKVIYLYCRECGFQSYIRKEQGARNYGAFLKTVILESKESKGGKDDEGESNEENLS